MANYCTESDIEILFQKISWSESSKMTSTQLGEIITQQSAWVDAKIVNAYEVPVTDSEMLEVLTIVCKYAVGAEVIRIIKEANGLTADERDIADKWQNRAEKLISNIINDDLQFPDADRQFSSDASRTGANDANGNAREAKFTIDKEY